MRQSLLILFFLFSLPLFSQKIQGKVSDSKGSLIEYATVALYHLPDTQLTTGIRSGANGAFILNGFKPGKYYVQVSFLGFENYRTAAFTIKKGETKQLGLIKLREDQKLLNEVTVSEERSMVQYGIDKKVYNPSKDIANTGGNATDVLQNIPSVQVDVDGNIQFRGSGNVTIYIDGKLSSLSGSDPAAVLAQIPADNIERIEIISNPSAKYDAQGSGGIINVVTKKGQKNGYNGSVNLTLGSRDKYQGSLILNFRKNRWNFRTSYGFNQRNRYSISSTNRELSTLDESNLIQERNGYDIQGRHRITLGTDFQANANNSLSFTYGINQSNNWDKDLRDYAFRFEAAQDSIGYRRSNTLEFDRNQNMSLSWDKKFKRKDENLRVDLNWSSSYDEDDMEANQLFYAGPSYYINKQNTLSTRDVGVMIGQIDYTRPLLDDKKLELGAKANYRNIDNTFFSETLDTGGNEFVKDIGLSNQFIYQEQIYAAYATFTGLFRGIGYSAGLRAEQTLINSRQVTEDRNFNNDYLSLFPSLYLSYKFGKGKEVQANYSRRINRPGSRQLNPFRSFEDPLSQRQGNPNLNPEFINSYELNYVSIKKGLTLSAGIYMRQTLGNITRFRSIDSNGVTVTSYENLENSTNLGIELVGQVELFKWWNINANLNFYNQKMQANNIATGLQSSAWGGNARVSSNWKVTKTLGTQLNFNYWQPGWALQGTIDPFYSFDIGLRQELFKGKGDVGLRLSDVFNTRQFSINTIGEGFTQSNLWKRETRILYLSFSWRFGMEVKKQDRGGGSHGGGGDMDGDF